MRLDVGNRSRIPRYILDARGEIAPQGVIGEIVIAGREAWRVATSPKSARRAQRLYPMTAFFGRRAHRTVPLRSSRRAAGRQVSKSSPHRITGQNPRLRIGARRDRVPARCALCCSGRRVLRSSPARDQDLRLIATLRGSPRAGAVTIRGGSMNLTAFYHKTPPQRTCFLRHSSRWTAAPPGERQDRSDRSRETNGIPGPCNRSSSRRALIWNAALCELESILASIA